MVVRDSGLSRKSIERYFPTKNDMVVGALKWLGTNLQGNIRVFEPGTFSEGKYTAAQIMALFMLDLKRLFFREPRVFVLFTEFKAFIFRNSDDIERDYRIFMEAVGYRALARKVFALGEEDGTVRPLADSESEARYFTNMLVSYLSNIVLVYGRDRQKMEELVDKYMENIMHIYNVEPLTATTA
jgi:AcrR family transcriptional regulator